MESGVAVIGAGSWGTALAVLLGGKGVRVSLWGHRPEHVHTLLAERRNSAYLADVRLPDTVTPTADLKEAVSGRRFIVMVVPSHVYRQVFKKLLPFLSDDAVVVSATKGIENDSLLTMTGIMASELHHAGRHAALAVLSGPSFAFEVAHGKPTAVTVACGDIAVAKQVQNLFFTEKFRVYTSADVIGVELGGPLKNIIALAAGICDGLDCGTNARAALITRGLAEISRLAVRMGANPLTMAGLAGLGDLVLTCTGELSRNRTVGLKLGQGMRLEEILKEMKMVAEGVKTTKSGWQIAHQQQVDMPILEQVYQVLYQDKPCALAVRSLLQRDQKEEFDFA